MLRGVDPTDRRIARYMPYTYLMSEELKKSPIRNRVSKTRFLGASTSIIHVGKTWKSSLRDSIST